mmetsp:Transcript_1147/g.2496  ORF Transcript_1147/g.2496 Transcript_1147/m.2496 type:complete len:127 (+) Transcript_1147:282-662(+)
MCVRSAGNLGPSGGRPFGPAGCKTVPTTAATGGGVAPGPYWYSERTESSILLSCVRSECWPAPDPRGERGDLGDLGDLGEHGFSRTRERAGVPPGWVPPGWDHICGLLGASGEARPLAAAKDAAEP